MAVDPQPFLLLMVRLCGAGILIQSLEVLWNWRELRRDRLLGWRPSALAGPVRRLSDWLHGYPACACLLVARAILAAAGIGWAGDRNAAFGIVGAMVVLQLYYNRRFLAIAGNCETLFLVCLVAVMAGASPGASLRLKSAALGFVAVHVALAYAVAGTDKVRSPAWRNGSRLLQVIRDGSYRLPGLAAHLENRPGLARALAWSVVALECLFPVAVFLPNPVFVFFLAGGICFHATIAILMGLHGFLWAFLAAYPAVWFVHALLQTWLR
ncbi:MAG TPA: hypothetical protein VNW30_08185 [Opitutaceae bacterium]|jgi:hypothetical protein|nr:hypothetical protein [Opitutaceae bacterium]